MENSKEIVVEIETDDSLALVEANYQGQFPRQMNIYLKIHLDEEPVRVVADTQDYNITGTPANEWNGHTEVFSLHDNVDASLLKEFVKSDLMEHIRIIADNYYSDWNGSNRVARFNDYDAVNRAKEIIENKIYHNLPIIDEGGLIDVSDWLVNETTRPTNENSTCMVNDFKITTETTDEQLQARAKIIEIDAKLQNYILDGDIFEYLKELRDECV
jgi:hypothetical protein